MQELNMSEIDFVNGAGSLGAIAGAWVGGIAGGAIAMIAAGATAGLGGLAGVQCVTAGAAVGAVVGSMIQDTLG